MKSWRSEFSFGIYLEIKHLRLKDFPEDIIPTYTVSKEALDAFYGAGNWQQTPSETDKHLRHEPEFWTVEVHTVDIFAGTDVVHQDTFICGDKPKDLFRSRFTTPSLLTFILNVKYVNFALHRIDQEFSHNWVI